MGGLLDSGPEPRQYRASSAAAAVNLFLGRRNIAGECHGQQVTKSQAADGETVRKNGTSFHSRIRKGA